MAELGNFDATTVDPSSAFEPIPNGNYRAAIIKSELKPTKNKKGHFLELCLCLLDDPHKGRQVFHRLNLDNQNKTAVDIAERELSAYCHATGEMNLQNSEQLHDKPITIKIVAAKRSDNGEPTNEVKGPVLKKDASPPAGAESNGKPSGDTPPWKR